MLKLRGETDLSYGQQPRKKIKLNVIENEDYNEFKGEIMEEEPRGDPPNKRQAQEERVIFNSFEEENKRNHSIFQFIKQTDKKVRKLKDASRQEPPCEEKQVKTEEISVKYQSPQKVVKKDGQQKKGKGSTGQSNWAQFISKEKEVGSKSNRQHHSSVAIDCQFVKAGEKDLLARVSIVNDKGVSLLDKYVRPKEKITDYLTSITGITYLHIKKAPSQEEVVEEIKKILYSQIVVGHTVWKDLEVCGLSEWKGWKALVDISEFQGFKEKNGKLISLKNLSLRYLGRKIQDGAHSSAEDAVATMDLFKLRKKEMLKQLKLIV